MMIRLDKIKATAHLESFTFNTDLENGRVVALGELQADGEAKTATAPADVAKDIFVLHASVPMAANEADMEEDFVLKAGEKGRGYIVEAGDIVTITNKELTAKPTVGDLLEPVVGSTKLKKVAAKTANITFKAIAEDILNGEPATVLQVL